MSGSDASVGGGGELLSVAHGGAKSHKTIELPWLAKGHTYSRGQCWEEAGRSDWKQEQCPRGSFGEISPTELPWSPNL